ncbi:MAG: sugar ABC transporter permease [Bosea sp.]|uniref:carbohydrate ABC transporter permease n=1 Tax=Bosea sp. (in: a-proteobacteria) TaxID=1871050 RepID=UPI001AD0EDA2|nr:sugar ABC transporter permease [Bosea sp. (in: a-proteobacteria)]MBN9469055.1 sugar ABC transporter permease [Bosea sp. (in: a-proteobacteria)]
MTFKQKYREELLAFSFLWPALLILVALLLYPLGDVIRLSFYDSNLQREVWVGLGNYVALFNDPLFWKAFIQTVVFTFFSVVLHLVIGLALALLLNMHLDATFRSLARGLLIVPWLLAPTVAGMIWVLMLQPFGVFNGFLVSLGLLDPNGTISWLGDPSTALGSVTAMNVWRAFPFFMVMLLAGLQAIPRQLYEAAEIDGATLWEQFWHITLPQLHGVMATIVLLDSIWTFRAFDPVYVMTGGGPAHSSEVLATAIYFDGFQKLKFGYASAQAVVMFVVLFIVSAIYVRRTMRNV